MPNRGFNFGNRAAPARFAAVITILCGLVSLVGWALRIQPLTSVIPGAVEMKANTALCLGLAGAALLILSERATRGLEIAAKVMAAGVLSIGIATLSEYFFNWQLGIDELLFKDPGGAFSVFRGRMSPFSAAAFALLGFSICCLRIRRMVRPSQLAAWAAVVIGLVSLLGYFWHAVELITDRWLPPVAVNTALCFSLLGAGVLAASTNTGAGAGAGAGAGRDSQRTFLATVEIKIAAGFILAISLLAIGGSFTYRASTEFAESVQWIAHTQELRAGLSDLYGSVAGAEVAQRDYFLTKNQTPLDEYFQLTHRVQENLDRLVQLTSDNPTQVTNLDLLRTVVQHRLDTLANGLYAFQTYGLPAARAVLALSRSINTVEDVRAQTDQMDALEVDLLKGRQAGSDRVRSTTLISLLVTLAAASALFMALFRAIHREMLARRGAEQALRDSDQYNRSIIESSPDCVAVLTTEGHITQMTPQGLKLMEILDFSSVAGKDWCEFWKRDDLTAAQAAVASARSGAAGRFHGFCATRSGIPKWWDVIVMPIRTGKGQPERLLAVARDITDVKRTETNLLSTNRFLDSLIENLPVMVVVKDAATLNFVRLNRAFETLIGYSKEQLIGKSAHDFFTPEEAQFIVAKDREALAGGALVDIPQQNVHTAHLGVRTFHTMKVPIGDEAGRPQFLLAMSVDITDRKLAEEAIRELNGALVTKAGQLEATNKELESFSYSVSHDLRAPLRAIDGFAEIIEEDYKDKLDDEGRRYLSVIRANSRRMGTLIDDLLSFSRLGRQPVARMEVNVDLLVKEVVEEVLNGSAAPPPRIKIGPLPVAVGDRSLLRQVWTNLISNAVKYSSKVSNPAIEVSGSQTADETHYSVRDNGVGFNMDYVGKLFGVFQRLHRNDEFSGTGVGLAIVQRVVTRHGGRVWAEGKIDEGAVFSFALPKGVHGG